MTKSLRYSVYVRTSPEWRQFADEVKSADDYTCTDCKTRIGPLRAHMLHVHHPDDTYDRLGIEQADDCYSLCAACHIEIHQRSPQERSLMQMNMRGNRRNLWRQHRPANRPPTQMRLPLERWRQHRPHRSPTKRA